MATGDTTARNSRASDWASNYATATISILAGATTLVTHTFAGYGAPATGIITANPISSETILNTGTADSAVLTDAAGTYTLTVGTSGADINFNTLTFIAGETSSLSLFQVNFPAT